MSVNLHDSLFVFLVLKNFNNLLSYKFINTPSLTKT